MFSKTMRAAVIGVTFVAVGFGADSLLAQVPPVTGTCVSGCGGNDSNSNNNSSHNSDNGDNSRGNTQSNQWRQPSQEEREEDERHMSAEERKNAQRAEAECTPILRSGDYRAAEYCYDSRGIYSNQSSVTWKQYVAEAGEMYVDKQYDDALSRLAKVEARMPFDEDTEAIIQRLQHRIYGRKALDEAASAPSYEARWTVPGACFVADELESNAACDVLDAAGLGLRLESADDSRGVLHILAEELAQKAVFLTFPPGMKLESRVALVTAMYEAESRVFSLLENQIDRELIDNQNAAILRRQFAFKDANDVRQEQEAAVLHSRVDADQSDIYIRNWGPSGISLQCDSACMQLVGAARTFQAFD